MRNLTIASLLKAVLVCHTENEQILPFFFFRFAKLFEHFKIRGLEIRCGWQMGRSRAGVRVGCGRKMKKMKKMKLL